MHHTTDLLAFENTLFTAITAICAVYLSFMALKHSARPRIVVKMLNSAAIESGKVTLFIFEFTNVGHWFAKPTAIDFVVFCNFDTEFRLMQLRYGSSQSYIDAEPKIGVGGMVYFKAKGLKLTYGEEGEQVHVRATAPKCCGRYKIRISGFSENGANLMKEFWVGCEKASADPVQT